MDAKLNSSSTQSSAYLEFRYSRMFFFLFFVMSVSSDFTARTSVLTTQVLSKKLLRVAHLTEHLLILAEEQVLC